MAYGNILGQNNYLQLSGGTMTGGINMNGNKISGLVNGVDVNDAVNLGQVQTLTNGANPFQNLAELIEVQTGQVTADYFFSVNTPSQLSYNNNLIEINISSVLLIGSCGYIPYILQNFNSSVSFFYPIIICNNRTLENTINQMMISFNEDNKTLTISTYNFLQIRNCFYSIKFYKIL